MQEVERTSPTPILRTEYRPPAFLVDTVELAFDLAASLTVVRSRLQLRRNPAHGDATAPLRLDGEALSLRALRLDGLDVPAADRGLAPDGALILSDVPDSFSLEIETGIAPHLNSEFSGLYMSGGNFFTQCEAEGFRRITWFPDRPDVMARFTVTLTADPDQCPVLLSNGNPDGNGKTADGRHWARWVDPHPKPSYLFALVAGDLVAVRDHFTTRSGRPVELAIWVREGDQDRCGHAMLALKNSMSWDEEVYGLEYDLDVFNIAAVSDFNMGAMENKGLNVFNTKYILALPDTATDGDYQGIETVVAHEYFHNWTGNRVTCRDWFQLSLKEGLTVFRDQEFTADQGSRAVKRLADVRRLRAAQFPEDAGPLAHAVRPDSYIAIDNFYTATIYQKGAEIVRMMHTMIGGADFRAGMNRYLAAHDNSAVTIEDFILALQQGSSRDLSAFSDWYAQAGTPNLSVSDQYDPDRRQYRLTLRQSTPATPGQPGKRALPIPVAMGLLGPNGNDMPARLQGEAEAGDGTRVLLVDREEQTFVFDDVAVRPVPSLLRGYSAPVKLTGVPRAQLRFLAAHDSDPFVRWDSLQAYAIALMLEQVENGPGPLDEGLADALDSALRHPDPAFSAEVLHLPSEAIVADHMEVVDPDAIHATRQAMRAQIGARLAVPLRATHERLAESGPYRPDGAAIGRRALRNMCLSYLAMGDDGVALARGQFNAQSNMTDVLAALEVLAASEDAAEREAALAAFHARWRGDDLVLDKWFAIQAMSPRTETLAQVRRLYAHPDFDLRNPNRFRSLVGAFSSGNPVRFHDASGQGYRFLADAIMTLDPMNSQTAARLTNPLGAWRRQNAARQALMRGELERILAFRGLSRGTFEKTSKALG